MKTYRHFIAGQYVDPLAGKWIESRDPYRGEAWYLETKSVWISMAEATPANPFVLRKNLRFA